MRWRALAFTCSLVTPAALVILPSAASAQTADELVADAARAAPHSVSAAATVMDLDQNVLREGTNGWVCLPDDPEVPGDSPMCLDEPWLAFLGAFLEGREAPEYSGVGIGYMLRGDFPTSNTDPFATGPAPGNEWLDDAGPHVMVLVPDREMLESLPTSPGRGPWVMWADTPYAHIMIPVPGLPAH